MFKKLSTLFFVLMASISSTAMAGNDIPVKIDGKNIVITDSSYGFLSSKRKLSLSESSAVYVPVAGKNIQSLVRERLELAGIHTVDSPSDATIIAILNTHGSIAMEDVDKAAEHTAHNVNEFSNNLLPAIGAALAAGPVAGIAFMSGTFFDSTKIIGQIVMRNKNADLIGAIADRKDADCMRQVFIGSKDADSLVNGVSIDYKLEKGDGKATDDVIFKALVDQWIKFTFILPEKQAAIEVVKAEN
jgi:hypothetical protein